jgi:predicted nucleotidyltransferase
MHPLIETNREAIANVCRRYGVKRLEVFGSVLREDFDLANSDVDVVAEFEASKATSFTNYLDFKQALESLFARPVDVLQSGVVRNPYIRREIELSKTPVYAA